MKTKHAAISIALMIAMLVIPGAALSGWSDTLKSASGTEATYSSDEATSGVKEVLSLGTDSAIATLGTSGGFAANPSTAFSLPEVLSSTSNSAGLLSVFNSAAESATPSLGGFFDNSINSLDVINPAPLIQGGGTSITSYFETAVRPAMKELIKPIVRKSLELAGIGSYQNSLSIASETTGFDAIGFVSDRMLDGIFFYIGIKEQDIRTNGGAGGSDLLKQLF